MHSLKLLAAVAAFAGFAAAQCDEDIEIKEANPSIDCEKIDGSVTVHEDVAGELMIDGPKEITGDLKINNVTGLLALRSSSINSIGGQFELNELNGLNTIRMDSLRSINELKMVKLTALRDLTFGSEGVSKATKVEISDTFLNDLSGLKLTTVETIDINNNQRLTKFESSLTNVTDGLYISSNGKNMEIDLPELESAAEIQIANAKGFRIPMLESCSASLKLDKCELKNFAAPNLTEIKDALSFINNEKLSNISLPVLKEIGGDLRIVNNTELTDIGGFPKLERMASINFGGNFENGTLPSLDNVKGTSEVSTSAKNQVGEEFCKFFEDADSDNKFQGKGTCTYDNENALDGGDTDGGQSGSSGSGSSDDEDAAGMVSVNTALVGLGLLAGIAQLL